MEVEELDRELLGALLTDLASFHERILENIPADEEHNKLLKHLAASTIHTALFARDLFNFIEGKEINNLQCEIENSFIDECGCDFGKWKLVRID